MPPVVDVSSPARRPLKYTDQDVDEEYIMPKDFDATQHIKELTEGKGFTLVRGMYTEKDIEMAKEIVYSRLNFDVETYTSGDKSRDFGHNNFSGLDYGIFGEGRIFAKMACHPAIIEIAKGVVGERCRMSSYCCNTVPPGYGGQKPHLDYPYYREMWPKTSNNFKMAPSQQLSMVFVTCLTDFTPDTGATAVVPYSQLKGEFPDNEEEFRRNCVRLEAKAGDVGIISGRIQHCAMPNVGETLRSGLIQQMAPLYVNPFQDFNLVARDWHSQQVKDLMAIEVPKW